MEVEAAGQQLEAASRQLEAASRQLEAQEDRLTRLEADNTRHFSHDSLPRYFNKILPLARGKIFSILTQHN
jgi:hypothetical protein